MTPFGIWLGNPLLFLWVVSYEPWVLEMGTNQLCSILFIDFSETESTAQAVLKLST